MLRPRWLNKYTCKTKYVTLFCSKYVICWRQEHQHTVYSTTGCIYPQTSWRPEIGGVLTVGDFRYNLGYGVQPCLLKSRLSKSLSVSTVGSNLKAKRVFVKQIRKYTESQLVIAVFAPEHMLIVVVLVPYESLAWTAENVHVIGDWRWKCSKVEGAPGARDERPEIVIAHLHV